MAHAYIACVSEGARAAFMILRAESGATSLSCPPGTIFNGVFVEGTPHYIDREPGNPIRILFAGRFEAEKGADLIPEIIRMMPPLGDKKIELCIYGNGTYKSALGKLAAYPPPGWTIQINAPTPNLMRQMPEFDLLIMPSRFEGLGLVAIEAIMMGLPVVATDAPGLREVFVQDYPWLATPGDANSFTYQLAQALENPLRLLDDCRKAREFVKKHFDIQVMCDAYESLYHTALAS